MNEAFGSIIKKIKDKKQKDKEKKFWKQHYSSIKLEGEVMDIRNLKALAVVNVLVSELTGPAKKQLIRYIKEADGVQLMSFLMDSEIVALDESAKEIVEDRFAQFVEDHYYDLMEAPLALADYMEEVEGGYAAGFNKAFRKPKYGSLQRDKGRMMAQAMAARRRDKERGMAMKRMARMAGEKSKRSGGAGFQNAMKKQQRLQQFFQKRANR